MPRIKQRTLTQCNGENNKLGVDVSGDMSVDGGAFVPYVMNMADCNEYVGWIATNCLLVYDKHMVHEND